MASHWSLCFFCRFCSQVLPELQERFPIQRARMRLKLQVRLCAQRATAAACHHAVQSAYTIISDPGLGPRAQNSLCHQWHARSELCPHSVLCMPPGSCAVPAGSFRQPGRLSSVCRGGGQQRQHKHHHCSGTATLYFLGRNITRMQHRVPPACTQPSTGCMIIACQQHPAAPLN